MSEENKISRGLGEYEGAADVKLGKKGTPGKEIKYTGLDGNNKGKSGLKAVYLIGTIDDASRKVLSSLKPGDKFVVVKTKKPGEEYYNVSGFETAEGYTAKEAWKPSAGGKPAWTGGAPKKEFDNTGLRAGTARNVAIAFLAATKGTKFTAQDVQEEAKRQIVAHMEIEEWIKNGMKTSDTELYQEQQNTLSQLNQDQTAEDDLDF